MKTSLSYLILVATLSLSFCPSPRAQCVADLNLNALVDYDDLLILLANYGQSCETGIWHDPIISEIHYNPSTQQGADSEHEFVELMNPYPFDIHVGGWQLGDGIACTFSEDTWIEAEGFLVTANDTAVLAFLLPEFVPLLPWTLSSGLHNSGESLRLIRPNGTEADHVIYSDAGAWPQDPDGAGESLEWKGIGYDNSFSTSWAGSNALGGSPGTSNSTWAD